MTEREEREILNPPQNDPENASADAFSDVTPRAPVSGECSTLERLEATALDQDGRQSTDRKDSSMDIHAPMGKVKSLKEFATHILIVTIGILIAFSLEGARESWREHAAVKEVRESLRAELTDDQSQLNKDLRQVRTCNAQLDKMIAEMPGLAKSPTELNQRVGELGPGFYSFNTTAWDSALSSNTLNYMERKERDLYVSAYVPSHRSYAGVAEEAEAERKLRALRMEFGILDHVGQQITPDIQKALDSK
jgi:uncharacterized protein YlxW (UPF0749 family)